MEYKKIHLLLNYKGDFGNKFNAIPYHSGYDKNMLSETFANYGFEAVYLYPSEIDFRDDSIKKNIYLYSSMEDYLEQYKLYLEDILYALSLKGAIVLPEYKFAKAHHNKVFMEILRDMSQLKSIKNIHSLNFGALEEFEKSFDQSLCNSSWVIKSASGASSIGVKLSCNRDELYHSIDKLSYIEEPLSRRFREIVREFKYKDYKKTSKNRRKFIVQNFIEGLSNDWKVLVFGDKYYIVERPTRKGDFRASGSGKSNYHFGKSADIPDGIFDFAKQIYKSFNVPMISLDIAQKNGEFYLLEMQFVAFGNSGHYYSREYFYQDGTEWKTKDNTQTIEEVYVQSIVEYIKTQYEK